MKKCYLAVAFLCGLFFTSYSQQRCAFNEVLQRQMAADPAFAEKVRQSEKSFGNYHRNQLQQRGQPTTVTIPVVVHIVYNTPEQNISDAQVQSQMDVLNQDFTATNKDYNNYDAGYGAVKGDFEIKFCLQQIVRKPTSHKSFPTSDGVKFDQRGGSDAVNPMNALNVWVCNLGQNLLGYAQFPGGDAASFGVVCHYKAFGKGSSFNLFADYNLGRTMTHEIGHCLGLRHIWGDSRCGNDFVDDTPLHNTANFGCPGEGHLSTCTGTPLEMFMNYMDYTDDRCMYFFSDGQVSRADFFIDSDPQLQSIFQSSCTSNRSSGPLTVGTNTQQSARDHGFVLVYPTVTNGEVNLRFNASIAGRRELVVYDINGKPVLRQVLAITQGSNNKQLNLGRLSNGTYLLKFAGSETAPVAKIILQQ